MMPPPKIPEQSPPKVIVIYDGNRIVFADFADASQMREIVKIIQKHKSLAN